MVRDGRLRSEAGGGRYRLLVEEHQRIAPGEPFDETRSRRPPGRLIYAESFELDSGLLPSQ